MNPAILPAVHADRERAWKKLPPAQRLALARAARWWLRPEQQIPAAIGGVPWRYYGHIAGRGFGKTEGITHEIHRRVWAGEAREIGLMAPTEDRVDVVQIQPLIRTAPPWFKPEMYRGHLVWPNGAKATVYTSENERARGDNLDFTWLTEIVDWKPTTRRKAFDAITTATRIGLAQVVWDTTSKDKNDVILHLLDLHDEDPKRYPIVRGSMLDNHVLTDEYIAAELRKYPPGRRRDEEVFGKVYEESAGALWRQKWIDDARLPAGPDQWRVRVVGLDPAISTGSDADPSGLVEVGEGADGEYYITEDHSERLAPEEWGDKCVQLCIAGASGLVLERNRGGDLAIANVRARAKEKGLIVRDVTEAHGPFPRATPGVIYVRQIVARDSKDQRAVPVSALYEQGHVHHVGVLAELELELTTYVPGSPQSPNRYDALVHALLELGGSTREETRAPSHDISAAVAAQEVLRAGIGGVGVRTAGRYL